MPRPDTGRGMVYIRMGLVGRVFGIDFRNRVWEVPKKEAGEDSAHCFKKTEGSSSAFPQKVSYLIAPFRGGRPYTPWSSLFR